MLWLVASCGLGSAAVASGAEEVQCFNAGSGEKQLLWGDLHVHTAWSLDAYAFGAAATPKDAFAFARGQPLRLADGEVTKIDRPLDFTAVTDHAETFDVMYLCTDPMYRDDAYCKAIRDGTSAHDGRKVFTDYLLPIVAQVPGVEPAECDAPGADCGAARQGQWQRVQAAANDANEPCRFTAFIGYEWSASPGGRHWHRNIIFRSDRVPDQAFDYLRYPDVHRLWAALDRSCRPADGCDVLAIPHNINWADGGGFDVDRESSGQLALRARFERLAEIHQEKGNSECLPADPEDGGPDCSFERLTHNFAQEHVSGARESGDTAWARMRSTYYRSLLTRGLLAYESSGRTLNPLMLGAIGSTDNHLGTPGRVQEKGYWGAMSMLWQSDDARLTNPAYNPGGLVAVWASQNTRASVFDALERREAYATSGPRIKLRFSAVSGAGACSTPSVEPLAVMGGTIHEPGMSEAPAFMLYAGKDHAPLASLQIVKVELRDGGVREQVHDVATFPDGQSSACRVWRDGDFDRSAPAFWYARVLEQPTPRWSRILCQRLGNCADHPEADRMIQERAWSSPIWYQPSG